MKKILLFTLTAASFVLAASAQKKNKNAAERDSAAYYMHDENMLANSEKDATFLRLIIKKDSGMFEIQDYWMDAKPRLLATSLSNHVLFEPEAHGLYTEYYPNGSKRFVRRYDHGRLVGDAEEYYQNGGLKYVFSKKPEFFYMKKFQDTTGKVMADNGNGIWRKYNESFEGEVLEGAVVNGRENGEWKQFVGDSVYAITYQNGVVTNGKERLGFRPDGFAKVEVTPTFPGGEGAFGRFLSKNVNYPAAARDSKIEGRVVITFVVERDGSLTNMQIKSSPHEAFSKEALRVMKLSPLWKPGMQGGNPVRVQYSLPISFSSIEE